MGPKTVGPGKVYFLKSAGNVGDVVDITEYIMGGGFTMNPNEKARSPRVIDRDRVVEFVENVLGINPGLVRSVHIADTTIEVELVEFRLTD